MNNFIIFHYLNENCAFFQLSQLLDLWKRKQTNLDLPVTQFITALKDGQDLTGCDDLNILISELEKKKSGGEHTIEIFILKCIFFLSLKSQFLIVF